MGIGDLVQKAVYLGIGVASYAGEKAGATLGGLPDQLQKLADEMVSRGEMTAEEGRKFVDDMVQKAQQAPGQPAAAAPRKIEIDDAPAATATASPTATETVTETATEAATPSSVDDIDIDTMRRQVMELQEELRRLRRP